MEDAENKIRLEADEVKNTERNMDDNVNDGAAQAHRGSAHSEVELCDDHDLVVTGSQGSKARSSFHKTEDVVLGKRSDVPECDQGLHAEQPIVQQLHAVECTITPEEQPVVQQLQELESTVQHLEKVHLKEKGDVAPGQGHTTGNVEGYDDTLKEFATQQGHYQESLSTRSPYSTPRHSCASISLVSQTSKHKVPSLNLGKRRLSNSSYESSLSLDSSRLSSRWQDVNLEDFPLPMSHRLRSMQMKEPASLQTSDSVASFLSACSSDRRDRTPGSHQNSVSCPNFPGAPANCSARRSFSLRSRQASSRVDLPIPEDRDAWHFHTSDQTLCEGRLLTQVNVPCRSGQLTKQDSASDGAGPTPKPEGYFSMDDMNDSTVDLLQMLYQTQAEQTQRRQSAFSFADDCDYKCPTVPVQSLERPVARKLDF